MARTRTIRLKKRNLIARKMKTKNRRRILRHKRSKSRKSNYKKKRRKSLKGGMNEPPKLKRQEQVMRCDNKENKQLMEHYKNEIQNIIKNSNLSQEQKRTLIQEINAKKEELCKTNFGEVKDLIATAEKSNKTVENNSFNPFDDNF